MTYVERSTACLPQHITIAPEQLSFGHMPNIQEVGYFGGRFSVQNGTDSLRLSVIAASAADITQHELKDHIGAGPGTRLETNIDAAYNQLGMTTPEAVGRMVARAWQRGVLRSEKNIWLPDLEAVGPRTLSPQLQRILGALSFEASPATIQASAPFTDIPVQETLEAFQTSLGIRSLAGAITFGFMAGLTRPVNRIRTGTPMTVKPAEILRRGRPRVSSSNKPAATPPRAVAQQVTAASLGLLRQPETPGDQPPVMPESLPPIEPKQRFNIPPYMRIIEHGENRPQGEAWPARIAHPKLDGQYVHWGGGIFRVQLPKDERLRQVYSQTLVLSCFDLSNMEIANLYSVGNGSYENVRSSLAYAHRTFGLPSRMARTVEALFARRWLAVIKYMPQPINTFFRDSLDIVRELPEITKRDTTAIKLGVDPMNFKNAFKKTYQSFGVTNSRGLLTRAYGLGIILPPEDTRRQEFTFSNGIVSTP